LFVEKVEKGLQDVAEGKVLDYKEVKKKFIDKWNQ
jgi:predicted transcriptional regulator